MPLRRGVEFNWRGQEIARMVHQAAYRGVTEAAEFVLGEANKIVPIETGALMRSGHVDADRDTLEADISYDTPYAAVQHENLEYNHDPGRQAKYLEQPLYAEAATVRRIVAARIERALD